MSFYKYMGKDWRKPFRGSKAVDSSCCNHGDCAYCYYNRTHFDRKWRSIADDKLRRYNRYRDEDY